MLELRGLHAGYGQSQVLRGVDLRVTPGEIVSLLGRNGSGRSTLLKAVMGLLGGQGRAGGEVLWRGRPVLGQPPHALARLGLGYVPEQRDVFPTLTVAQNLRLGEKSRPPVDAPPFGFDEAYSLFPELRRREHTAAGLLSGGEQQMLALARTMMGRPSLLLVDEPTEGLAPALVEAVAEFLRALRQRGVSVLLVEQKLGIALALSNRCLVMGQGRIVFDGSPAALALDQALHAEWLAL